MTSLGEVAARLSFPETRRWSREPREPLPCGPVVVVPPEGNLEKGWCLATDAADEANWTVTLVARGATSSRRDDRIRVVELDAYLPNDKGPLLDAIRAPTSAWLRRYFAGALGDVPVERALWASSMERTLRAPISAACLALGIAHHHAAQRIILTEEWVGAPTLQRALADTGGELVRPAPRRRIPHQLAIGGVGIAALVGALALRSWEYARQTTAREALRRERAARSGQPRIWVSIIGHWPHSCRHVLRSVGRAAAESDVEIGVLLQGALETTALEGGRREKATRDVAGFAALQLPELRTVGAVDQTCSVESIGDLTSVFRAATTSSLRSIARLSTSQRIHQLGPIAMEIDWNLSELSRLCTIELLRAHEARIATQRLIARRGMDAATVAFSHASFAPECTADLLLQRSGARTFDVVHGALAETMDMVTNARTFATTKIFWTRDEATYSSAAVAPQHCIGGYPSQPLLRVAPRRGKTDPLRVLLVTNYGTGTSERGAHLPRLVWQQHFFACARAVLFVDRRVDVRWRPHPGDDLALTDRTAQEHPRLTSRSVGRTLDEEIEWADLIITSISSVIVEASLSHRPLFIHAIPIHEAHVVLAPFAPSRLFASRDELHAHLSKYLLQREMEDFESANAPERRLVERLFGPTGEPAWSGAYIIASAAKIAGQP